VSSTLKPTSKPTDVATRSNLAFSKCMRANGVPNFRDLNGSGMEIQANGSQLLVNGAPVSAPAFAAARQKCQPYLPGGHVTASAAQTAQMSRQGLEFARCMRTHGVPTFPDPQVRDGGRTVYLPGIDPRSPAFQTAAKACGGFGAKGKP
jgi:hypothetical protein